MGDNFYSRSVRFRNRFQRNIKNFSATDENDLDLKNDVQWNSLKSLRLNIHTLFPKCFLCGCLKPNKD